MSTFNGCGTDYYGHKPTGTGTHITTKWICLLWLPLIPLKSYEVFSKGEMKATLMGTTREYQLAPLPKMNIKQVLKTMLIWWGIAILIMIIFLVIMVISVISSVS